MKSTMLKLFAISGPVSTTFLGVAMIFLMHIVPPLSPALSTHEVATFYRENPTGIIIGGAFIMFSSGLIFPFVGAIATFMKKIEGPVSPLTYSMMMVAAYGFVTLFLCGMFFTAAAFRPGFSDETIHALSDISFFLLIIAAFPGFFQYCFTGWAILSDTRANPVFPRWVGYLNFWTAVLSLPGATIGLFKIGPFAWNGILAFWLPAIIFGVWVNVMCWALLNAVKRNVLAAD